MSRPLLVASDLDSCLLDAGYRHDGARPALEALRAAGIPLVLASSKTRAEMQPLWRELGLVTPFIVENGGALVLAVDPLRVVALGYPRPRLVAELRAIGFEAAATLTGFADMAHEQIAALTGLPLDAARRAAAREWGEPFLCAPGDVERVRAAAERRGLRVSRGGRFLHLGGPTDKGRDSIGEAHPPPGARPADPPSPAGSRLHAACPRGRTRAPPTHPGPAAHAVRTGACRGLLRRAGAADAGALGPQDARDDRGRRRIRSAGPVQRAGRDPDYLRRPAAVAGQAAAAGPDGLPGRADAWRGEHGPRPALFPVFLGPRLRRDRLRGGGPSAGDLVGHRGAVPALPHHVRRCLQPRLLPQRLVPALPRRTPGVRGLLHRLHHPRRHRTGSPEADPAPAHERPADAVPGHRRDALRLDYLPSVFGARNDTAAVLAGADKRSINRKTLDEPALLALLQDPASWVFAVASGLRRLVKRRIATPAFHPNSPQHVLDAGGAVFALRRGEDPARVVALTNVTASDQHVCLDEVALGGPARGFRELLTGRALAPRDGRLELALRPYGVAWLAPA